MRNLYLQTFFIFASIILCSAKRLPFRTGSITAILPRHGIGSPVNILPEFIGTLASGSELNWTSLCYKENRAFVKISEKGFELHLILKGSKGWTCIDIYTIATPYRITLDYFYFSGHHRFFLPFTAEEEKNFVMNNGISLFLLPEGIKGAVQSLWEILPQLSDSRIGEAAQISFLYNHMNANFSKRNKPWNAPMPEEITSFFQSGDFIVTSKLRGTWGAFETLQKWVSGSWSGHSAVMMRDEEGKLWVAESGHYNSQGIPIIATLEFDDWWNLQMKDKSQPLIAVIPLHPEIRKIFNNTAAWEVIRKREGKEFGWHNIIFSWIDTPDQNFPPPITADLVAAFTSMWSRSMPQFSRDLYHEALNRRLGTEKLSLPEVMAECAARNITFGELLAIPEKDDWQYSDGLSTSCVAYVMTIWKAAGIFRDTGHHIQATEFTIRDAYMLKIFGNDLNDVPDWCQPGGEKVAYCQITGKYRFDLPLYNTIDPYPKMNENCPTMPPNYYRPHDC